MTTGEDGVTTAEDDVTGPLLESVVVTVGEELLSGATLDRNAAWLSSRLGEMGLPVWRAHSVGDRDEDIAEVVRAAALRSPFVIVTGGLGPTADDRTREAVAGALGVELVENPTVVTHLEERYRAAGRSELPSAMRALALQPTGGRLLPNPVGAAPGVVFPSPTGRPGWVVLLPGVPREMRAIFPRVGALVESTFGASLRPVRSRTIHTTGIPESQLAPRVEAALGAHRGGLEIAYLPDLLGVDLRLSVRVTHDRGREGGRDPGGPAEDRAQRRLEAGVAALEAALLGHTFVAPSGDLIEATAARLEARGWSLATAESCTGGLLAQRYTARAGASATFRGAIVAYANDIKTQALGVPAAVIQEHGAVSEEVARRMAIGARDSLGADCSVSITGIAGPGGGTPEKPVGTVWIGVCTPGSGPGDRHVVARRYVLAGDREAVRVRAAQAGLHLLYTILGARTSLDAS